MKSASIVLDFHCENLEPSQRSRVLGAMLFYAREESDQVHEAWKRNREEMAAAIERLSKENEDLKFKLTANSPVKL